MTAWFPDAASLQRPVYLSLAEEIAAAIGDGRWEAGHRLPTHRDLARKLRISVQTVSRAYEELIRRGLVSGEVGRGSFVRSAYGDPAQPFTREARSDLIDFSLLRPVLEPMHLMRMRKLLAETAETLPSHLLFSFRPQAVHPRHLGAARDWLSRCGVEAPAKRLILTNGITPASLVALITAARPGNAILTEERGHHTLKPLVSYLGMQLRGLPIDEEGILPEPFERACTAADARALYLLPSAAGPTAAMMGLQRRRELVEIARREDIQIIENDALGPLVEERPPPFVRLAPERSYYLTSFTKCVLPGLRAGYLVVPEQSTSLAANRHLASNWMATPLMVELATRWVEDGTAVDLTNWQRKAVRQRQGLASQLLRGIDYRAHPDALHLWLPLPQGRGEEDFLSLARSRGVTAAPGAAFTTTELPLPPAVRVALGATSLEDLRSGLEILADILRGPTEPSVPAV